METGARRIIWADYAKALGIFLMLLGHCELKNQNLFDWIYTFHMPLFFILTGYFMPTKEIGFDAYFKKNVRQLIVPYVFYYLLTLPFGLFVIYSHPDNHPYNGLMEFLLKPLIGMFLVKTTDISFQTNGPSWFFVALFIVRLLFYVNVKYKYDRRVLLLSNTVAIFTFYALSKLGVSNIFRFMPALLGYPLITIGFLFRKYSIIDWLRKRNIAVKIAIMLACFSLCWCEIKVNGHVEFSAANYGNNILIMYFGGACGTIGIILLSSMLPYNKIIINIGANTGIILGLHSMVITCLRYLLHFAFGIPLTCYPLYLAILISLTTLLLLYPVIILFNKRIPKLIGKQS